MNNISIERMCTFLMLTGFTVLYDAYFINILELPVLTSMDFIKFL